MRRSISIVALAVGLAAASAGFANANTVPPESAAPVSGTPRAGVAELGCLPSDVLSNIFCALSQSGSLKSGSGSILP